MLKSNNSKLIFHIDMNAFFCSVEEIRNPSLRGKAFAVGREGTLKGVLSTASYEARKYGIHSAMPIIEAYHKLPSLIVVNGHYSEYKKYHEMFMKIIYRYTDKVEVASIDECYCDMTHWIEQKHPIVLAKEIQAAILTEVGLKCSIGIAPTLFLAKMASDMQKPLGLVVLRKRDVKEKLYPLSVKDIFGIGKKTYPLLIENGIETIGDFMDLENKDLIISLIGINSYNYVVSHVQGNSSNVVDKDRYSDTQSISTSSTYDVFLESLSNIIDELRQMARSVYQRLIKGDYVFKTVTLTLRDQDFKTITRQKSFNEYQNDLYVIYDTIEELLDMYYDEAKRYRLIGVGVSNLVHTKDSFEYNLFNLDKFDDKKNAITKILNDINKNIGSDVISFMGDKKDK